MRQMRIDARRQPTASASQVPAARPVLLAGAVPGPMSLALALALAPAQRARRLVRRVEPGVAALRHYEQAPA